MKSKIAKIENYDIKSKFWSNINYGQKIESKIKIPIKVGKFGQK